MVSGDKQQGKERRVRFLHRRWQALVFALLASALSLTAYWFHPPLLENIDQRSRDVVFGMRESPQPAPEVAVVAVDERSIKDYGRWPWPRHLQAELIQKIKDAAAGTIALDITFAQPYTDKVIGATEDAALISALSSPGAPVVGGYFFRNEKSRITDERALQQLRENRIKRKLIAPGGHLNTVQVYDYAETNQAHIAQHMAGLGAFNGSPDVDGLFRNVPLVLGYRQAPGEMFPTLSLRALAVYTGLGEGVTAGPEGLSEVKLGTFNIPVDEQGRVAVNFYHSGQQIPIYAASDVLAGTVGVDELADRLIFIGITEIGMADLLPTPVSNLFPGVALHATVVSNIIQGHHLYRNMDTVLIDVALIAVIPLFMVLILSALRKPSWVFVGFFILLGLLGYIFYYFVAHRDHLISLLYPTAATMIAFAAFQVYYMLTSQRTAKFLTGAFSSYVSPDVVEALVKQPESLGLSGERREVTLLFSDIRDFTSHSERLEPERLVELLNRYFDAMTETILERKGTLDKYIGDAIMAIFNAPLSMDHHQHQAARSALAMIEKLNAMRSELKTEYDVELHIGVGLHCGEAVVGNLGSSARFDYTAIGDVVNLASRVESITKLYQVPIIITGDLEKNLEDSFVRRPLDRIAVKGQTVPADIYELMLGSEENQKLASRFSAAYQYYIDGEFDHACTALETLLVDYPEDGPGQLLLQRAKQYQQQPPGPEWDGVYRFTHK